MLTLRPTKMLARRIGLSIGETIEHAGSGYTDWCVHGFNVGPSRFLIFTHTTTVFSCVSSARGVTSPDALFRCFRDTVAAQLKHCDLGAVWDDFIAPEAQMVRISPVPNRSVLGCMNELIFQARCAIAEESLDAANREIIHVPMLTMKEHFPDRAFRALQP